MTGATPQAHDAGMRITAIMPAFNCRPLIELTLAPLLSLQACGIIAEVIVVDDGSTDATHAAAAETGARVIASGGYRRGPGAARNAGAMSATGDVLWFVDSDVIANQDGPLHIRHALAQPGVVAMFGSYDARPAAANLLSQYKNLVHHHYHQTGRREASTFWAGCGAVRRDAFLAVGGFDAARFPRPSIEDIELGYRLRAAAGRILLCPEMQGKHLKSWRLRNLLETEIRQRALPWGRLLLSGKYPAGDLNIGMTERLRALIACLGALALPAAIGGLISFQAPAWLAVIAVAANLDLFALFVRANGLAFGLFGIAFHQIYYLYGTASYVWCWGEALVQRVRKRRRRMQPT